MMEAKNQSNRSFEEALARLEELVHALESGDATLDDSLSLFEEGVKLVKFCQSALDGAEQKVKLLQKDDEAEASSEE